MTIRKRRQPAPGFRLPPPFNPMDGERAPLAIEGDFPYCAMMQVAAEDTHDDYVVCRGYDPRFKRFFDYDENDLENKPGLHVGKPFGSRKPDAYEVGQIFPALIPLTRIGQTPGVARVSEGHPADLDEVVDILYDEDDRPISWLLLDSGATLRRFELKTSLNPNLGFATAHPLEGNGAGNFTPDIAAGSEFIVYDMLNRFSGWARIAGQRSGSWGYAYLHPDSGWWEILNMEQVAKYINFTLTEDMGYTANGQAAVTVDDWYDGTNPSIAYTEIKVYDPQGLHPNARSGAKGKARLDDRSDQYHIVEMATNQRNFACVQSGWTNTKGAVDAGSWVSEAVSVKTCDYDDASTETGDAFDVQTMPHKNLDTALFTDYIIEWATAPNGDKVIVSHIWDDPIGTVKWESVDTANIRDGWRLCNGADGAPDLRGRFIMGRDLLNDAGDGSETSIGDTGGFREHGAGNSPPDAADNDHDNHSEQDVVDCIEDHLEFDVVSAIRDHTILDHVHTISSGAQICTSSLDEKLDDHEHTIDSHQITGGANDLEHDPTDGHDLTHSKTDNRSPFYVMAAIQRFE